jgi:ferritin-like metal-binding protein YciE
MGLKETYNAEKQILDVIPNVIDSISSQDLKNAFKQHMQSAQEQISRLEDIFDMLDLNPEEVPCNMIKGLIEDCHRILSMPGDPKVKDAAIIAAEQKAEHFHIAVYGTLRTWAQEMGHDDVAEKLQMSLKEEYQADKTLSDMAKSDVNISAPMM